MRAPLRFATLREGVIAVALGEQVVETDVRILRESNGSYRVLAGDLSESLPTIESAISLAEGLAQADRSAQIRWREPDAALRPGEHACPICGALAFSSPRHSNSLCPACVMEATDRDGRRVRFLNADASGGIEGRYVEDGAPYNTGECFVRGVQCRAEERRFGGVVVQPTR
jgi:hypothetical protein